MAIINKNMFTTTATTTTAQAPAETPANGLLAAPVYQQRGVLQAGLVGGSHSALSGCLDAANGQIHNEIGADTNLQNQRKTKIHQNIADLEGKNKTLDAQITGKEKELKSKQHEKGDLRKELAALKTNKTGYYIGIVIIALLTVYLFIFYSSAAYSAFFKNFTPDDTAIVQSIFDPNALSRAWNDGVTEMILILTIPMVFLGLGFLLHKMSAGAGIGKYFKITALIATTFIFDFILAYEIVEKIYSIKIGGSFEEMPPMTIGMAFYQVNFWMIIFAGFVVYIIWGLIFDFVMIENAKLHTPASQITDLQEQITQLNQDCRNLNSRINELRDQRQNNLTEIKKLNINGPIVYWSDVVTHTGEFFTGWCQFLQAATQTSQADIKIKKCKDEYQSWLANTQLHFNINNLQNTKLIQTS